MKLILLLAIFIFTLTCQAETYISIDENGSIYYATKEEVWINNVTDEDLSGIWSVMELCYSHISRYVPSTNTVYVYARKTDTRSELLKSKTSFKRTSQNTFITGIHSSEPVIMRISENKQVLEISRGNQDTWHKLYRCNLSTYVDSELIKEIESASW